MKKLIELEIYFDDNFVPPERFDEPTWVNRWDSKCKGCPFFGWDDESGDSWCNITTVVDSEVECPIRKFF